jgi:hypothetical protein
MAKIILNVDLQAGGAEQELAKFKKSIQGLGDPKGVKNIDNLRKGYANLINTIQKLPITFKRQSVRDKGIVRIGASGVSYPGYKYENNK